MTNIEYIKDKINAKQNILTVRKMAQKELGDINTLEIAIAEDETEIKYLESILCDLEVLEILKNYLEIKGYNDDFLYPIIKVFISSVGTEKDFNKVKEWLENE